VVTASYESLFTWWRLSDLTCFPRGISEAFSEHRRGCRIPNLAVEKNLLIYYPWPYYFFFNKDDQALAIRVEVGLRKMVKGWLIDAIFQKYNGEAIHKARLKSHP